MAKTLLNIKVDVETKLAAKKLAEDLGLPLSVLVNAQLKQLVRGQRVEFVAPYRMSSVLEKKIAVAEKDLKIGRNLSPVFTSVRDMDSYLDAR